MPVPTIKRIGTMQIVYILPLFSPLVEISIPILENIRYQDLARMKTMGDHHNTTHPP